MIWIWNVVPEINTAKKEGMSKWIDGGMFTQNIEGVWPSYVYT